MTVTRFRWAACQIETIRECRTVAEIEEALDNLPETLDDIYERVLQAIWKIDAEKGRAIFTWLLFSERPLTLHEMAEAAVFRPGDTKLNPRDRLTHLSGVLSICRSLIILSNEMNGFPGSIYAGHVVQYVRFAHFSVKEYLTSGRSKVFTGLSVPSHEYIGKCCISMLLAIDDVQSPYKKMEDLLRDQYLLCYAAGSWFFHIKQLEALAKVGAELSSGVWKLLDHGPGTQNYHAWMQIYDSTISALTPTRSRVDDLRRSSLPPLFYACRLGLSGETHRCIKAGSDVNQNLLEWGTPLHAASIQENYKITEILLHCGADAKTRDKWGRTAFGVAAIFGHEENRRFLFDHGIDINDELEDALENGGLRTIRFLLEHGAYGNPALRFAVRDGYFDLVQLILETSTDLNTENYACALFVAARDNYPKTFGLVLERVTSIRAIEAVSVILLAAVHGASLEIISRLVKSGVDINALGSVEIKVPRSHARTFYTTALQYAVYRSNHDMANYLLENGAEVNSRGFSLGTELQAAIQGHVDRDFQGLHSVESTLGLLLEHGADVNQQVQTRSPEIPLSPRSRKQGTALQQAAAGGLDSVAQLLVKEGADINAQHNHCGTALMCASRHATTRTLQVLVDMKADINARVGGLGSALSEAARWGRCENVQFLVDYGADVDAEVEGIGTALLTALLYGQFGTAAVLIEAGADFHAAVWHMSIAFSTASEDEGEEIGKLCFASCHPYPKLKAWENWDNWFLECEWRERKPDCIL